MGRDKASLPWGGTTMLDRVVGVLSGVVDEIVVVARRDQPLPPLPSCRPGVGIRFAHDEVEGRGPLGGLAPGLEALTCPIAYASSCDVPFLSTAFVRAVFEALGDVAMAMPETGGRLHPLAAVYRRDAVRPHVEALLREDRLRLVHLLERVPHVIVPERTLRAVDPDLLSLENLNTPQDWEAARRRGLT
jgi:molybdopterin-guanine dinucleotide biosynthesis protein A